MYQRQEISETWIKASILGTIWAASEIVLGSFLHNLRIPFSSNILTAIGIIILVSAGHQWKDKGLFWRSGLICALMKTISPSAVIFGPMIAIFSQAMLLDLSARLFRNTVSGYITGAILAMSWNLFQKIINFIIFYGFNIVAVYADLLEFTRRQLNIQFDIVWLPVFLILVIDIGLGVAAAMIGVRVGRRLLRQDPAVNPAGVRLRPAMPGPRQHRFSHSIVWLVIDAGLIVAAMFILNRTEWRIWILAITAIVLIWIIRYKRVLKKLSRPRFWVWFVLITMATAFVFNKMQSQSLVAGLLTGIQMNLRAVIIILGFSVIGTELYNPKIRDLFVRTSFRQLPAALELSFSSLPEMISMIPDLKVLLKNPVSVIHQLVSQIDHRLLEIKKVLSKKIVLVTAPVGKGKTTQIRRMIDHLPAEYRPAGGILSLRLMNDAVTTGYDVVNLRNQERSPFLRLQEEKASEMIGNFVILEEGLTAGREALSLVQNESSRLMVIDEVGKLELEGRGWAASLNELLHHTGHPLILSVRDSLTEKIVRHFHLNRFDLCVIPAEKEDAWREALATLTGNKPDQ